LFNNNQIEIFKYSGLKNSKILIIISLLTFIIGIAIVSIFYNASSNLKNFYLELKSNYTTDGKYLAVINKNGLWIRDKIKDKIIILNASKIDNNYLINNFITEFDKNYKIIRNIKTDKIDIKNNNWIVYNPEIYTKNIKTEKSEIKIYSNFTSERINSLFSNLSSLSFLELLDLKKNYELLNYSTTDINIQIQKIISYPLYLVMMTLFSGIIMLSLKKFTSNTLKVSMGLFLSVLIYYINNIFNVLGATEKINITLSVWFPIFFLFFTTLLMVSKINEK